MLRQPSPPAWCVLNELFSVKQSNVIGAGIVGLATALALQDAGRQVTLFDRLPPGEGTSAGNAGIISTGSIFPEAEPGIWKAFPGMLLDRLSPVTIRPGYLPQFLPWLGRFVACSSRARYDAGILALAALSSRALEFLDPLLQQADAEALLRREGVLYVYSTRKQLDKATARCLVRERLQLPYRYLEGEAVRGAEPTLREGLAGAIEIPNAAHTLSPLALSRALFALFQRQGGQFVRGEVTGFDAAATAVRALVADRHYQGDEFFITAGAYSHRLARQLGSRVPLVTERGYHLMLPEPGIQVIRSLIFGEQGFAVTPMRDGLRLAGTVEFAGLDDPPQFARARVLAGRVENLLPGVQTASGQEWIGYRPSVPDSLPVISPSPRYGNVYFGFGHGHLGLTQAAITGAILACLAQGRTPPVEVTPYRVDRSWW